MADNPEDDPLERALFRTLALLQSGGGEVVRPWELWSCLTRIQPSFATQAQQDLFECYQVFAERPNLATIVGSDRAWRIRCEEAEGGCGFVSTTADRVATWMVALPSRDDDPPLDLGTVLRREARAKEPVPDWVCPRCGRRAGARRLMRRSTPDCLVIQLLRFAGGGTTARKLAYPVTVPTGGLSVESIDEGECITVTRYALRAFATHTGDLLGGHYEAFISKAGTWWRVDDAKASKMAPMPQGVRAAPVYALFLQRAEARCGAFCGRLVDDVPCPIQCWHPHGHVGHHFFECLHTLPPDPPAGPPLDPEGG